MYNKYIYKLRVFTVMLKTYNKITLICASPHSAIDKSQLVLNLYLTCDIIYSQVVKLDIEAKFSKYFINHCISKRDKNQGQLFMS